MRDAPPDGAHGPPPDPLTAKPKDAFAGVRRLFSNKDCWIISFGTFCRYGIYAGV
ncbi:MAG: hypothetical protein GY859_42505, partial [Desulfobacterales bacterium]|nr:hypothetical protein [Desulfobacterales bacterium]